MKNIKNKFVPPINNELSKDSEKESFEELLKKVDHYRVNEGDVVKGHVVAVLEETDIVVVDVGLKSEGRIPLSEFQTVNKDELPKAGDVVSVYVEKVAGKKGTVLSRSKAIHEESWKKLEQLFAENENVMGTIFGRIKGGFTVDIQGVVAFLPGSQADVRPIKDPESIMHILQPFQILTMDAKSGNIVVSRKAILEDSRSEAREEMLSKVKEGDVFKGYVKNITNYGAFIDLGNIDGLLHVTDISWSRINHPSEVLNLGQEVEVAVIKFNEETKRISLGMKQLDANPWDNIRDEIPPGKVMTGKITNITDYGGFIEIKNGIEGLVHSSEISWGKTNQNPKKLLTIGQEMEFMVLDVDEEKHRISLSLKRCKDNPLVEFSKKNPVGSVIKAPIRNITDFGIFVAIGENTDGMIHESDISWAKNGVELLKTYKKDDELECKVLTIDIDKDRVALGIKQLSEDPYKSQAHDFTKNMVVTCTVVNVSDDALEVSVEDKAFGTIKRSDLSTDRSDQKVERFAEGDRVDAKIIFVDKNNHKLSLSIKALELDQRNKAIKEYGSTDSGASLGDILGAVLEEDKKKSEKKKEEDKK